MTPTKPCFECLGPATTMHHVVPRSRGGTATVPLCDSCHAKAHHRDGNMATRTLTMAAMKRMSMAGTRVGEIPFGWKKDRGNKLAKDMFEQVVIDRILLERSRGESLRAIAMGLNRDCVPSKKGAAWSHSSVQSIIDRHKRMNEGAA